jgi:hypothetical protein
MRLPCCLFSGVVVAVFVCSISGQSRSTPATKPFEGCYELTLGRWWPWSFGGDNEFVTPPSRIQLLSEHGTKGFEKDGFLIRRISPKGRGGPSYWRVNSDNQIDLMWNDGFTGVTLVLKKHGRRIARLGAPAF